MIRNEANPYERTREKKTNQMGCCLTRSIIAPRVKYKDVREELKTGDLVLFCGATHESVKNFRCISGKSDGNILSQWWVQIGTCSPFSHIGVVVRCDHLPRYTYKGTEDNLYLLHSNGSELCMEDVLTGTKKAGVQMNWLERTVRCYKGDVYFRRIVPTGDREIPTVCSDEFHEWLEMIKGKNYTDDLDELLRSTYDGPLGFNSDNFRTYFCSKLVAHAFMHLGYLEPNTPASEYIPSDFSSARNITLEGIDLEPEELIIVPKPKQK
jgi:hypothetical protein